jgi:hypothetical protein
VSRIEQSGRISLRRPKPPIKGGSTHEEEDEKEEEAEEESRIGPSQFTVLAFT